VATFRRVFFGILWFIFIYFAACFIVGAIAGGIAGADDPEHAREAGAVAGRAAVANVILWIVGGSLVIAVGGSVAGVLPGTRAGKKPRGGAVMYSSTFTFAPGQFDDTFHRLDQQIAAMAKAIPGYLGEETWENAQTGLVSNVYYWDSLEALQQLVNHPQHREAKAAQGAWLAGYQVVISQVLRTYGDDKISALLPQALSSRTARPS